MTVCPRTQADLPVLLKVRMTDIPKKPNPQQDGHVLDPAQLAYLNPEFLNSPDGRILRILSEYAEPLARFRREQIQDTVVFFGSARFGGIDEARQKLALLKKPAAEKAAPENGSDKN